MIVSMLKNWSRRYYSQYIIKFIGSMPIYYAINFDIVSYCIVFSYLYIILSIYYKFESINIIFLLEKINLKT